MKQIQMLAIKRFASKTEGLEFKEVYRSAMMLKAEITITEQATVVVEKLIGSKTVSVKQLHNDSFINLYIAKSQADAVRHIEGIIANVKDAGKITAVDVESALIDLVKERGFLLMKNNGDELTVFEVHVGKGFHYEITHDTAYASMMFVAKKDKEIISINAYNTVEKIIDIITDARCIKMYEYKLAKGGVM